MALRIIIASIIGGILGFLYYKLIGCQTGACPIKSNPLLMTLYGAIMLALITELAHDLVIMLKKQIIKK